MADAGIVRNRAKIQAAITNARAALDVDLAELIWSFAPDPRPRPRDARRGAADRRPSPRRWRRRSRRHGFRFVGPTTAYAMMQACGLVDDHIEGCHVPSASTDGEALSARAVPRGGRPRRARAGRSGRTRSSTSSRRSTGARRWTARRGRSAAPADLEMLLVAARRGRRRAGRAGHVRAEGYGRLVGARAPRRAAAGGADLAPLRHPVGGGAVRRRRPAGDRLRAGRRARRRPTSPRRSRSCGSTECTPGGRAGRPARRAACARC